MTSLRDLFNRPADHTIGGLSFSVCKLQFDQFDDAAVVARYLEGVDLASFNLDQLEAMKAGRPEREALKRTLASCLSVKESDGASAQQLQPQDVEVMPIVMLAEALAVVMEVNADFFFQTAPNLLRTALRIRSTGLALLNRLSEQATAPTA